MHVTLFWCCWMGDGLLSYMPKTRKGAVMNKDAK